VTTGGSSPTGSPAAPRVTLAADRLYGITMRPQELAWYGEAARFHLSYAAIYDDPLEVAGTHFKLLVVEITAPIAADDPLRAEHPGQESLQLLKCGWELELSVEPACQVGTLVEQPAEIARLLDRVADTVNDLARRAGLDAPLGPDVVTTLLHRYRTGSA
jgi:hypothetical protein